jgi:hypothetical protein
LELQPKVRKQKASRVGKNNRVPQKDDIYEMKPLIRKNKSTIQQQGYLQSESWKKGISKNSQHLFHQNIALQRT